MSDFTQATTGLSLAGARAVLSAARSEANRMELRVSIAVVDQAGNLLSFERADGATILSVRVAQGKAFTAATSGFDTGDLADYIQTDPPLLAGIPALNDLVVFGGGLQLRINDAVVGAIGVSGGHYSEDVQIARAGSEALK